MGGEGGASPFQEPTSHGQVLPYSPEQSFLRSSSDPRLPAPFASWIIPSSSSLTVNPVLLVRLLVRACGLNLSSDPVGDMWVILWNHQLPLWLYLTFRHTLTLGSVLLIFLYLFSPGTSSIGREDSYLLLFVSPSNLSQCQGHSNSSLHMYSYNWIQGL